VDAPRPADGQYTHAAGAVFRPSTRHRIFPGLPNGLPALLPRESFPSAFLLYGAFRQFTRGDQSPTGHIQRPTKKWARAHCSLRPIWKQLSIVAYGEKGKIQWVDVPFQNFWVPQSASFDWVPVEKRPARISAGRPKMPAEFSCLSSYCCGFAPGFAAEGAEGLGAAAPVFTG